jgi:tRNA-specific 2-thiouridylase
MNPCVDCRIFLLRQAKAWMETHGHHFIFTGEVVGQRPKSQMRSTLRTVERESSLEGYLLRPLSARLLKPTIPEQRGWVDREKLYGISGRGRKAQIALAEKFGITDYPQPSGGCCYLIHRAYSRRLRDFLEHEGEKVLTTAQVQLLAVGRHLRLPSGHKVVVGRHEQENEYLESCDVEGVLLTTPDHPGPTTLVPGNPTREEIEQAARITASYSDGKDEPAARVEVHHGSDTVKVLMVAPMAREEIHRLMV